MLPQLWSFKRRDWLLSLFFAAQVHWTVAMSQMIQDDSQLLFAGDPTGNQEKWKKKFPRKKTQGMSLYIK